MKLSTRVEWSTKFLTVKFQIFLKFSSIFYEFTIQVGARAPMCTFVFSSKSDTDLVNMGARAPFMKNKFKKW